MTQLKASSTFAREVSHDGAAWAAPRPVLVTGLQRTGTTWLGKMLGLSPSAHYLFEPFNHFEQTRPKLWGMRLNSFYTYIHPDNAHEYRRPLDAILGLRCMAFSAVTRASSFKTALAYTRESMGIRRARLRGCAPVIKDPNLFFSASYLADQYGLNVVVTIRHPAAFVASIMRLNWTNDFHSFLSQPRLMADYFPGMEEPMRRAAASDIIDQGMLLWTMFHEVVTRFQASQPQWIYVRNEDVSVDPQPQLRRLYEQLGLAWDERVTAGVAAHTGEHNPAEAPEGVDQMLRRNSAAAAMAWKRRLTADQITRIRNGVEPVASRFYSDADWQCD